MSSVSGARVQCTYVHSEKEVHRERGADGAGTCLLALLCFSLPLSTPPLSPSPSSSSSSSSPLYSPPPLSPPSLQCCWRRQKISFNVSLCPAHYTSHVQFTLILWTHKRTQSPNTHANTRASLNTHTHTHTHTHRDSWWRDVVEVFCSHILISGSFFPPLPFISHMRGSLWKMYKNRQEIITPHPIVFISHFCLFLAIIRPFFDSWMTHIEPHLNEKCS